MPAGPIEYEQFVWSAGHELRQLPGRNQVRNPNSRHDRVSRLEPIERAKGLPGLFLVGRVEDDEWREPTRFDVFETEPALFRKFADTPITPERILRFANQYGLLWGDVTSDWKMDNAETNSSYLTNPRRSGREFWAEPLRAWAYEISRMRQAITHWDAIRARNLGAISERFSWDIPESEEDVGPGFSGVWVEHEHAYLYPAEERILLGELADDLDGIYGDWLWGMWGDSFTPGDPIQVAYWLLRDLLSQHLEGRIENVVLFDRKTGQLRTCTVPQGLSGALWLQLALAVEGSKDFRACAVCSDWFELSRKGARKSRKYCSNACRTMAYRIRKGRKQ